MNLDFLNGYLTKVIQYKSINSIISTTSYNKTMIPENFQNLAEGVLWKLICFSVSNHYRLISAEISLLKNNDH